MGTERTGQEARKKLIIWVEFYVWWLHIYFSSRFAFCCRVFKSEHLKHTGTLTLHTHGHLKHTGTLTPHIRTPETHRHTDPTHKDTWNTPAHWPHTHGHLKHTGTLTPHTRNTWNTPAHWPHTLLELRTFYVLFVSNVLFCVLFVCKCVLYCTVLYYWQRVSTQLQLNKSYHIKPGLRGKRPATNRLSHYAVNHHNHVANLQSC